MNNSKIITIIFAIIIILFIVLFSLFFLYIYNDYTKTEMTEKTLVTSEITGEIKPITFEEDIQETEIVELIMPNQNNNNDNTNNNEEEIISNKFYYNQLNEYSKLIYESLEGQKENLKTGNSLIKLPNKISEILELEQGNVEAVFSIAINAFEYDNPDVFYLDNSKMVLYYERDSLGNYSIYLKGNEQNPNYLIEGFNNKEQVEQAQTEIDRIVEQIKNETEILSTENKIRYIHDWLVSNIKYDETLNKINRSNIYGAFIEKEVTCAGYAKAFKYIIDKLNIECIIVQGTATSNNKTENHAWNYIKLDNKWYGIDCTWDDPIIIGGNGNESNKIYYTYYLKGKSVFDVTHKPFTTFYGTNAEIEYPELN